MHGTYIKFKELHIFWLVTIPSIILYYY